LSSVIDRLRGWFGGSREDKEPVEEEDHVAVLEEEQSDEFSSEYDENRPSDEHVDEEEQAPEFPRAH
jgi:hypothetical protein